MSQIASIYSADVTVRCSGTIITYTWFSPVFSGLDYGLERLAGSMEATVLAVYPYAYREQL